MKKAKQLLSCLLVLLMVFSLAPQVFAGSNSRDEARAQWEQRQWEANYEEWQRAGAYSVRVEGMNRQHHIPLREEFDEHDGPGTKYIVLLDDLYPVATCRFYDAGGDTVNLGRVVVLPEYRGRGLGEKAMEEAEKWIRELGYKNIGVDSRIQAVGFYEKLGFSCSEPETYYSGPFECRRMTKEL